jgi:calmodulin
MTTSYTPSFGSGTPRRRNWVHANRRAVAVSGDPGSITLKPRSIAGHRRNYTFDPHRKPVSVSADTLADIERIQASYRSGFSEASGGRGGAVGGAGGAAAGGVGGLSGRPRGANTGRHPLSFRGKHQSVSMDFSKDGLRDLTEKDRRKQQNVMLREVFRKIDSKGDGVIDPEELEEQLILLGYEPARGEAADMIWEVDDRVAGNVTWRQFKGVYQRVRDDGRQAGRRLRGADSGGDDAGLSAFDGKEPRRLYNVIEFMIFDIDNDGAIDLTEVMHLFYQRYGSTELFKDRGDIKNGNKQAAHDITFPEFVKHDESFYTKSRQLTDRAAHDRGERLPTPPHIAAARERIAQRPDAPELPPRPGAPAVPDAAHAGVGGAGGSTDSQGAQARSPPVVLGQPGSSARARPTPPAAPVGGQVRRLRIRRQNPARLAARRNATMASPRTANARFEMSTNEFWSDEEEQPLEQPAPQPPPGRSDAAVKSGPPVCEDEEFRGASGSISVYGPPWNKAPPAGLTDEAAQEWKAQQKQAKQAVIRAKNEAKTQKRVRRPSETIYLHYGLLSAG